MAPVLLTFYIQDVLKLKKNSGAKRLKYVIQHFNYIHSSSRLDIVGRTISSVTFLIALYYSFLPTYGSVLSLMVAIYNAETRS